MSKWWDQRPRENLYLEVTRRDDIGTDLNAPRADRSGTSTGGYSLVPLVRPGDLVVHYDSREREIAGVSVVLGLPEPRAVYWVARGRSAREAGAQPAWLEGIAVPLGGYRSLQNPVTLDQIQRRKVEILAVRAQLTDEFGSDEPLHFPWYEYGPAGPLRTQQSYLLKLPRDVVGLFPALATAMVSIEDDWRRAAHRPMSELDEIAEAIEKAAGRTPGSLRRRSLGQGFSIDQEAKVAVETRAMNAAIEHFKAAWDVEDVHGTESYDLRCWNSDVELHVEVKGTTTEGRSVLLTPNEVAHAHEYPAVALYVLSEISVIRDEHGRVTRAEGGVASVHMPWRVGDGELRAVGYEYDLPITK